MSLSTDYKILAAEACQELLQIIPKPEISDLETPLSSVITKIGKIFHAIPKSSHIQNSILLLNLLNPELINTQEQLQNILLAIAHSLDEISKINNAQDIQSMAPLEAKVVKIN